MKRVVEYRKLLEVDKNVTLKELKTIYRNSMKDAHPDKFVNDPEESVLTTLLRLITDYRYSQYEQAQRDLDKSLEKDLSSDSQKN
jgi:hypothetical protein